MEVGMRGYGEIASQMLGIGLLACAMLLLSPDHSLARDENHTVLSHSSEIQLEGDRWKIDAIMSSELPDEQKQEILETMLQKGDSAERVHALLGDPISTILLGVLCSEGYLNGISVTYVGGRVISFEAKQKPLLLLQRFPRGNQNNNF